MSKSRVSSTFLSDSLRQLVFEESTFAFSSISLSSEQLLSKSYQEITANNFTLETCPEGLVVLNMNEVCLRRNIYNLVAVLIILVTCNILVSYLQTCKQFLIVT